jgi:hypothetical protein
VRTIRRKVAIAAATLWIFATFSLSRISAAGGGGAQVISPAQGLAQLVAGNQRFQSGATSHPNQDAKRRESLVEGQSPFAVIVSRRAEGF